MKIKTETLPTRCEVCHRDDYFEAINNFCQRCESIALFNREKFIDYSHDKNANWWHIANNGTVGGKTFNTVVKISVLTGLSLPVVLMIITLINGYYLIHRSIGDLLNLNFLLSFIFSSLIIVVGFFSVGVFIGLILEITIDKLFKRK